MNITLHNMKTDTRETITITDQQHFLTVEKLISIVDEYGEIILRYVPK